VLGGDEPGTAAGKESEARAGGGVGAGGTGGSAGGNDGPGPGDGGGTARNTAKVIGASLVFVILAAVIILLTWFYRGVQRLIFLNDFHTVEEDSLAAAGWLCRGRIMSLEQEGESPGSLTLFT